MVDNQYSISSANKQQVREPNYRTMDENQEALSHSPIPSKYNKYRGSRDFYNQQIKTMSNHGGRSTGLGQHQSDFSPSKPLSHKGGVTMIRHDENLSVIAGPKEGFTGC